MHLTTHTDYALRVLVFLSIAEGRTASAPEMAERYGISLHHLRKVVQALGRSGYVSTERGRGGGVRLERDPADIRLGEVVAQMEPDMAVVECLGEGESTCVLAPACRLKGAMRRAREAFIEELDRTTLAEVVANDQGLRGLLFSQDRAPSG